MRRFVPFAIIFCCCAALACASTDRASPLLDQESVLGWDWALPSALDGERIVTSSGMTVDAAELPRTRRGDTLPERRPVPRDLPDRDTDDRDVDRRDDDRDGGWDDDDDWEDEDGRWEDDEEWEERGPDRRRPDRGRDRDRERERDERYDGRDDDGDVPPFCRDGRGHPRFGMDWCREKGYVGGGGSTAGYEGVPAFCRTGEGHPVFGVEWCRERAYEDRDGEWRRADVGTVRLPAPRREPVVLRERDLGDVLGGVLGDVRATGDWLGGRGEVDGVLWAPSDDPGVSVLQVRVGGVPVAELTDLDGDGIVDATLVMD